MKKKTATRYPRRVEVMINADTAYLLKHLQLLECPSLTRRINNNLLQVFNHFMENEQHEKQWQYNRHQFLGFRKFMLRTIEAACILQRRYQQQLIAEQKVIDRLKKRKQKIVRGR